MKIISDSTGINQHHHKIYWLKYWLILKRFGWAIQHFSAPSEKFQFKKVMFSDHTVWTRPIYSCNRCYTNEIISKCQRWTDETRKNFWLLPSLFSTFTCLELWFRLLWPSQLWLFKMVHLRNQSGPFILVKISSKVRKFLESRSHDDFKTCSRW